MPARTRRISLAAEAVGYVGAILIVAGGGTAIGQQWRDWSEWPRIGTILAASVGFLGAGIATRRSNEAAMTRLRAITWALSTAGIAGAAAMIARWPLDMGELATTLTATGAATGHAAVLWLVSPGPLQHAVLFAAGLAFVNGIAAYAGDPAAGRLHALVSWMYGFAWSANGHRGRLEPRWVALSLGAVAMLLAPTALQGEGVRLGFGIAVAVAVMAASVAIRFTPSLIMSAVALFGFTTATVVRYFRDSIGVPAALALTGAALLAIGALSARLMAATRRTRESKPADAPTGLRKVS